MQLKDAKDKTTWDGEVAHIGHKLTQNESSPPPLFIAFSIVLLEKKKCIHQVFYTNNKDWALYYIGRRFCHLI